MTNIRTIAHAGKVFFRLIQNDFKYHELPSNTDTAGILYMIQEKNGEGGEDVMIRSWRMALQAHNSNRDKITAPILRQYLSSVNNEEIKRAYDLSAVAKPRKRKRTMLVDPANVEEQAPDSESSEGELSTVSGLKKRVNKLEKNLADANQKLADMTKQRNDLFEERNELAARLQNIAPASTPGTQFSPVLGEPPTTSERPSRRST